MILPQTSRFDDTSMPWDVRTQRRRKILKNSNYCTIYITDVLDMWIVPCGAKGML
jgi:hypothetical protein